MNIRRILTYVIEIPLQRDLALTSALGKHFRNQTLLVRLETDDQVTGVGEATIEPRWSGETAWGAQALIEEYLAAAVLDRRVDDPFGALRAMDAVATQNPFAKAALETAMWDAWGKMAGKPVYELLGGEMRNRCIPIRFSLAAGSPEITAEQARRRIDWGHRMLKIKVGRNPKEDVERVRAVRDAVGPHILLAVDANGGWQVDDAIWALNQMRAFDLLFAEQPVRREDLDGMATVRRAVSTPIMADESVFTLWDAREAIRREACDLLSVSPGKNGGLLQSYRIAELAAEHDIPCAVGSNLELDPGSAAQCHLAVAAPNISAEWLYSDVNGPLYHRKSVAMNPLRLEEGFAYCPTAPGLGVDVNWNWLLHLSI